MLKTDNNIKHVLTNQLFSLIFLNFCKIAQLLQKNTLLNMAN
jgi:hypothetical protein